MPGARNYVFTFNNPSGLLELEDFGEAATYLIYSEEVGENGTYHLQGYVEFSKQITITWLSKKIPGVHFETRRGSQKQAVEYCRKVDDPTYIAGPYEFGVPKNQGERCDLGEIKMAIDNGASEVDIWDEWFSQSVRYHRSFSAYRFIKAQQVPRTEFVGFSIFVGGTGLGKSHDARAENPDAFWLAKPTSRDGKLWWDGYKGEKTVIIDEFYGWIQFDFLLRLCDKYPLTLEVKGATTTCHVQQVVITSNKHPNDWYKGVSDLSPLRRRITEIRWYHTLGQHIKCSDTGNLRMLMFPAEFI